MNEAQLQYRRQLQGILRLKVCKQLKREMLQSFQQVLRQHCQIQSLVFNQSFNEISMVGQDHKPTLIQSTKFSQSLSMDNMTLITQRDIYQLQQLILSKKIIKIQNYQEIESLQEQLYSIEDTVKQRQSHNQQLRKSIDRKMVHIEELKQKSLDQLGTRSIDDRQRFKPNRTFTDYFKSWWN